MHASLQSGSSRVHAGLVACLFTAGCGQYLDIGSNLRADASTLADASGASDDGATASPGDSSVTPRDDAGPPDGASDAARGDSGGASCVSPEIACGGVCRDPRANAQNCGVCGRVCGSGPCSDGACTVETILDRTGMSGPMLPTHLAASDSFLFWADNVGSSGPTLRRANIDGSAPMTLLIGTSYVRGIPRLTSTRALWPTSELDQDGPGGVASVVGTGGAVTPLGSFAWGASSIALDSAAGVVFAAGYSLSMQRGFVASASLNGGDEKALCDVQGSALVAVAFDASYVYALARQAGMLMRVARTGGTAAPIAVGFASPVALAVEGATAWVLDAGTGVQGFAENGTLYRVTLATGAKEPLLSGLWNAHSLLVTSGIAYVSEQGTSANSYDDGRITRIPAQGGPKLVVASRQPAAAGIVVVGNHVVWANHGTANYGGSLARTIR